MKTNDTEANILKAAEEEFLLRGFDGARTTSIAQAAGVTHAMLHYYFRTKEQLFERILDEKIKLMGTSVLMAFGEPDKPLFERIRNGVSRHFDFMKENPDLPRFVINEVITRSERQHMLASRVGKLAAPIFSELQRSLDEASERGEIVPTDARMLMLNIISLNVFTFIAYPIAKSVYGDWAADSEHFFEMRKEEILELIMRRIKK